jgi:peptidoglycan/xylan/chitin deacetylase (PgdA/CDA1 family)
MRFPGLKAFKRSGRQLRARFSDHALILGYHRIAKVAYDPYRICVSPQEFESQLEIIKRYTHPISLSELVGNIQRGVILKRAVVLTFDDGYADFFHQARPLLEQYDIPAAVFVVAGCLGQVFWWDRLQNLMDQFEYNSEVFISLSRDVRWNSKSQLVKGNLPSNYRSKTIFAIYRYLKDLHSEEREKVMGDIEALVGTGARKSEKLPLTMTAAELKELAAGGLVEVGSHSLSHPWISRMSVEDQQLEIRQSKFMLEDIVGKKVKLFSYPNGSLSKETPRLVQQAGYTAACISAPAVVHKRSNLFQLPRFWSQNLEEIEFKRWLTGK